MTEEFFSLIDRMNGAPASDRGRVEADIWDAYGVEMALLALDLSQFSLAVRRGGILPYIPGLDLATYSVTYQGNP